MLTETDEGKGLVKTYWRNIRKRVSKVEPNFAKIVDELAPDNTFPVFLAYYTYGAMTGDTETVFLPKLNGGSYKLNDVSAPEDVIKHLGYGKDSAPIGMLLDKNMELFIDMKDEGITIPWLLYSPGSFFPFSRLLSKKSDRIYAPNGVLSSSAGARSVFMLPNIGCLTNHLNLQRDFNIQNPAPKSLYEHWNVFGEIVSNKEVNCDWRCCLMYFSQKWVDKIHNDPAWAQLRIYLHNLAWQRFEFERNQVYYDIAFSVIQKKRNLKPNPYLIDTARHLFATTMGAARAMFPQLLKMHFL